MRKVQEVWGIFPFNFLEIFSTRNTQDTESFSNYPKYFLKYYQFRAFYAADFKCIICNILGWKNYRFMLHVSYAKRPQIMLSEYMTYAEEVDERLRN